MTDLHADELEDLGKAGPTVGAALVVVLALAAAAFGAGYFTGARAGAAAASNAEIEANRHRETADAAVSAARKAEAAEAEARALVLDADARAARAAAIVAKLRAELRSVPQEPTQNEPSGQDGLAAMVEALTEQTLAQQEQLKARDELILGLEKQRDLWRGAHDARFQEAQALRVALEAQKAAVKGALWRGRVQGFAFGFAVGFGAGASM